MDARMKAQEAEDGSYQDRPARDAGLPSGTANSGATAASDGDEDGKFDLRQFVNSTSRWPLQEDVQTASRYGGGRGGGATDPPSLLLPPRERETVELCDLPGQLFRSVWSGRILGAMVAGLQALLLLLLETAAVWTPRAVEFACRLTAVHLPVLCVSVRDWSTTTAPRLASRAWHAVRTEAPRKMARASNTLTTVWWPASQAWALWFWAGTLAAASVVWDLLQRLTAVRSVFSHTLGLLVLGLHRCYNFLVLKFRAHFPDAFESMVGAAGACERRCVPVLSRARLRVGVAWNALLMAIIGVAEKVKAVVAGGAPTSADLGGVEQGEATVDSETAGTALEGFCFLCCFLRTRGYRVGRKKLAVLGLYWPCIGF